MLWREPAAKPYICQAIGYRTEDYTDVVGVFDVNRIRANIISEECGGIPVYDDFDLMLENRPDAVIVTTVDGFHHEAIIRALGRGVMP